MIIRYPGGREVEVGILSRKDTAIRVVPKHGEDVLEFSFVAGRWVSEDAEPVEMIFEWQRHTLQESVSEADCVCSKDLAARLMHLFVRGDEPGQEPDEKVMTASAG